jgi:hypothetical protein
VRERVKGFVSIIERCEKSTEFYDYLLTSCHIIAVIHNLIAIYLNIISAVVCDLKQQRISRYKGD